MRIPLTMLTILASLFAMSGCAQHTTPLGPVKELSAEQKDFDAVWLASLQVLRKYYFPIDHQDRRAGMILTEPITGKAMGEFWRSDAATMTDLAESAIQTIYRQAAVTISESPPGSGTFTAAVEVQTYRSNREVAGLTSASDAFAMFRRAGSAMKEPSAMDETSERAGGQVTELGRDEALEAKIASDIAKAAAKIRAEL